MTWFANYIFAEPKPAVISSLCAIPEMSQGLYLVKDLDDFQWFDPKVRHNLPSDGLLVGREVCDLGSYAAEWHGDNAISWNAFVGPETVPVIGPEIILSSPAMAHLEQTHLEEAFPPVEFLRFLKWLNLTSKSVITFYYCATWGGDTEAEFAWVFIGEDKLYLFRDAETVFEYGEKQTSQIVQGTVLNLVLSHYGFNLPSHYFALCTRSFGWNQYRVAC